MAISSEIEILIEKAIEREDEASLEYRDLEEESPKNNIRWFLKSFSEARGQIRDKLITLLEEKVLKVTGHKKEDLLHIGATEHLHFSGNVDKNSLQSVLLFISKKESEDLEYFRGIVERCDEGAINDALEHLLSEKEKIHTKADRLYHDMIEQ